MSGELRSYDQVRSCGGVVTAGMGAEGELFARDLKKKTKQLK